MSATARQLMAAADWQPRFLAALAVDGNVAAAARAAGINKVTAYRRRNRDDEFAAAWERALVPPTVNGSAGAGGTAVDGDSFAPGLAAVPPAVAGSTTYYHPKAATWARQARVPLERVLLRPSVLGEAPTGASSFFEGVRTNQPIDSDGVCPDCGWVIPAERQYLHAVGRDDRLDWCARQNVDGLAHQTSTAGFWAQLHASRGSVW